MLRQMLDFEMDPQGLEANETYDDLLYIISWYVAVIPQQRFRSFVNPTFAHKPPGRFGEKDEDDEHAPNECPLRVTVSQCYGKRKGEKKKLGGGGSD